MCCLLQARDMHSVPSLVQSVDPNTEDVILYIHGTYWFLYLRINLIVTVCGVQLVHLE